MDVGMPDIILRWLQYMSTFDLVIEYRPGKLHGNADGLSRPPIHDTECGSRACVCITASTSMEQEMEPYDGEPTLEPHPDIEPVKTKLIGVVTRSGRATSEAEPLAS